MGETPIPPLEADRRWRLPARLLVLAVAWLALTRLLLDEGALLLPASVARQMTLEEFLPLAQAVSLVLGLLLARLLFRDPRGALGLRGARPYALSLALLAAPGVFVAAFAIAIAVALPTLLAEIRRGGAEVSRQDLGAFGRAVKQAPLALTFLWTAVAAPLHEEILFRGAVWSALARLTARAAARHAEGGALPPELFADGPIVRGWRWAHQALMGGGLATLGSAAVFGAMHLGVPGGVGIVRVVSATCLGLGCGAARQLSGSVAAPLVLHVGYNVLAIAQSRGWLVSERFPKWFGIPTLAGWIAGACGIVAVVAALAGRRGRGAVPSSDPSGERF